ncbi:HU family DNA-binding protein [Desulforegula conservatrix]|uniref:HU family DNA-binding protein n=1 Tax=Desulforegula conservatrix TaxID=153026 RepID=UPI0003F4FFC3|nr:HU family DNA-binding protein [Desulforegula conservatrix]
MNKLELIEKLKTEARITRPEAVRIVNLFFDEMSYALSQNDRVEIRGLFSMFLKNYESYTGRNPKTGEKVTIQPKKLPFFKAGKELKDRINSKK